MKEIESLYFQLFAASADAIEALEQNDPFAAREILIQAQRQAEERYIEMTDSDEE